MSRPAPLTPLSQHGAIDTTQMLPPDQFTPPSFAAPTSEPYWSGLCQKRPLAARRNPTVTKGP